MPNPNLIALDTMGRIAFHAHAVADLEARLKRMPLWLPGAVLSQQAAEAQRMIGRMQERLHGHLVATLIGPTGAGKSTLFNALAGADDLSPVGIQRPTTRDLVVLAPDAQSVRHALGSLDGQPLIVRSGSTDGQWEHLIMVDTPDTDSNQSPSHLDLLYRVVERSDVLICVFDAQNPKRRDHADFMAPLVRRFNGASLVAVVNKCDRQSEHELTDSIRPDFETYLRQAWPTFPESLLLISARRHLHHPGWDSQTVPRHELDQFDQLRQLIAETFNRPGAGRDRRVANAGRIHDYLREQAARAAAGHREVLSAAREKLIQAEHKALQDALAQLRGDDRRHLLGINARMYQALAQRWLGPVGWLVAIWSRLIIFGSGLTALVRFGNPLRQLWGAISSWKRYKESRSALELLKDPTRADTALVRFRKSLLSAWPDIAAMLIQGGFDPAVRRLDSLEQDDDAMGRTLDSLWSEALDSQINRSARTLSHPVLQLVFNLPGVTLLGYVGWLTAKGFFTANYLSSDFFLHALLTIAIVMLLCFFLLQGLVRLVVGKDRLQRRAFDAMGKQIADHPLTATHAMADQLAGVMELYDIMSENYANSIIGGK